MFLQAQRGTEHRVHAEENITIHVRCIKNSWSSTKHLMFGAFAKQIFTQIQNILE
jgi:hypothetical protein